MSATGRAECCNCGRRTPTVERARNGKFAGRNVCTACFTEGHPVVEEIVAGLHQPARPAVEPGLDGDGGQAFEFVTLAALRARVRARGPRRWLLRSLWPAGAYGVHAAEMKAGKSWNACDLAVAVASGTPWLGHVPVDAPGPVVLFWGEGDDGSLVRRIDAICDGRSLDPDGLPVTVCCRAPHLASREHRDEFDRQVAEVQPALVILDPFYLAARGANGADLYAMGELLEHPQRVCVQAGAALLIVTHFNRKEGRGAVRITGAGPAEWGRVLIAATVKSRRTDPLTKATTVITELDVIGGEIPDTTLRLTRTITADAPDDLDSPLRLSLAVSEIDPGDDDADDDMPPARRKLLEALHAATGPRTGTALVDWIAAEYGHGLLRQTVSTELNELHRAGQADYIDHGKGRAKEWFATQGGTEQPPEQTPTEVSA